MYGSGSDPIQKDKLLQLKKDDKITYTAKLTRYGDILGISAEDGTIEAVEDSAGRWVLGVQWHPERTPEDPASQALFMKFVSRAAEYKKEKEACGTW